MTARPPALAGTFTCMTGGVSPVACLLVAFIAMIAMLSAILGGIGNIFGQDGWSLEGLFGAIFAPFAWLMPWSDAIDVGTTMRNAAIVGVVVAPDVKDATSKCQPLAGAYRIFPPACQ